MANSGTEIINKLLSEVAAGELRAQRSLRVMQHQEIRLEKLNQDLQNKSKSFEELQGNHDELLQTNEQLQEVDCLQKQLIKLQEVQYLTLSKMREVESRVSLVERKESSSSNNVRIWNDNVQTDTGKPSTTLTKPFSVNSLKANDVSELYGPKGAIYRTISSVQSFLTDGLRNPVDNKMFAFSNDKKEDLRDHGYLNAPFGPSRQIQQGEIIENTHRNIHDDFENERLKLLRLTLSQHRQSIDNLSSEVVELKQERVELLVYLKNLLDWRADVEKILHEGFYEDSQSVAVTETSADLGYSRKPIVDITTPKQKTGGGILQSRRYNATPARPFDNNHRNDKMMNSPPESMISDYDENNNFINNNYINTNGRGNKLCERAQRLWDTACKYFRPDQAHHILTAQMPSDYD